jgi:2Fe-2S ferredoxin
MMRSSSFYHSSSWGLYCGRDSRRRWVGNSNSHMATAAATGKGVKIVFYEAANQNKVEVDALVGRTVLDVAIEHNIDIEGACGGELACSTCHVVLSKRLFDQLPPKAEEEEDMLDLAWGLTDT